MKFCAELFVAYLQDKVFIYSDICMNILKDDFLKVINLLHKAFFDLFHKAVVVVEFIGDLILTVFVLFLPSLSSPPRVPSQKRHQKLG